MNGRKPIASRAELGRSSLTLNSRLDVQDLGNNDIVGQQLERLKSPIEGQGRSCLACRPATFMRRFEHSYVAMFSL